MRMTKQEFLASSGLQVQVLEFWLEQRWLVPEETNGEIHFQDVDIARVQLIRELRERIGANDEGVDVILHLMDQLHGLRRALTELRAQMGADRGRS